MTNEFRVTKLGLSSNLFTVDVHFRSELSYLKKLKQIIRLVQKKL